MDRKRNLLLRITSIMLVAALSMGAVELYNLAQNLKMRFSSYTGGVSGTGAAETVFDWSDKPTYSACSAAQAVTAAADMLHIESGTTNTTRILKIWIVVGSQTTAGYHQIVVRRSTSASTGGTAVTPSPHVTGDAAFSGIVRFGASGGGTDGVTLYNDSIWVPTATTIRLSIHHMLYAADDFLGTNLGKPIVIPVGTANGIEIRNATGGAGGANHYACATFVEEPQ